MVGINYIWHSNMGNLYKKIILRQNFFLNDIEKHIFEKYNQK
jgi:hypothetical protein